MSAATREDISTLERSGLKELENGGNMDVADELYYALLCDAFSLKSAGFVRGGKKQTATRSMVGNRN